MNSVVANRVIKGLGANGYGQLVTIVVQLVGVPVLLDAWGAQLYGEWLVLFAIPAYLSIADLGFSHSVGNDMVARVARGDRLGALTAFQSLTVLVYGVIAVLFVFSTIILWLVPLERFLNFEIIKADEARWVLWLLISKVLVELIQGVNYAGFRAAGEYAFHQSMHATSRLMQFSAVWVVALAGGGPTVAAGAFAAVNAFATVVMSTLLTRRHRWLTFGIRNVRLAELRRLLRPALANISMPLSEALNVQGMVIVVATVLGPRAVVLFSTLRTLTRMALHAIRSVARSVEPEMAAAYGASDQALMRTLFVHGLRASAWLAIAVAVALILLGEYILDVWTNGQVHMDLAVFGWLIASALANVLWFLALVTLRAANKHMTAALLYMLSSAAAVGVAASLLKWTGQLAAVGLTLLAIDALMILYTLFAAGRLLVLPPMTSILSAANPLPLFKLLRKKHSVFTS